MRTSIVILSLLLATSGVLGIMSLFGLRKKRVTHIAPKIDFAIPTNDIRKEVLKNGMTVLVFRTKSAPKVLAQIAYDIGSAAEEAGERGLAHLLEHMIFKGTAKDGKIILAEGDIDSVARKYGANFNAFTAKDMTSYYFEVNKNNWEPFLPILADCMQNARFDDQHLASELLAVIQELKMYKDKFWSRMFEKASELAYPSHHPYHFPIIGYREDLAGMSGVRLKKFYEKYYHPSRATLLLVGDIDPDTAIEAARKYFGSITPLQPAHTTQTFPDLVPDLTAHATRIFEDVQKEQLGFYWIIPGLKQLPPEVVDATVHVLGGGEGSRLHQRLVDKEQIADGISVDANQLLESGLLVIFVEPKEGKSDRCHTAIQEELTAIIKNGPTAQELSKFVMTEAASFFHSLENLQDFTYEWIVSYYTTRDHTDVFKRIEHLYQVDAAKVQQFVSQYLDPFLMHKIELLPLPADKKELWQKAKHLSDAGDQRILAAHKRTQPIETPTYVNTLADPEPLAFSFPKPVKTITLQNGLTVVFYQNGLAPLISISLGMRDTNYLASSQDGIVADVMMGMLMEGSKEHDKQELVDFFEERGVEYSFGAGGGSVTMINNDPVPVLERFFHVMSKPDFKKDPLEKIKAISIDSYVRAKDVPMQMGSRILRNIIYKNHPYAWTYDEAIERIRGIQVRDIEHVHSESFSPTRMVLSVAGSYNQEQIEKEINRIFGPWTGPVYQQRTLPKPAFEPNVTIDYPMLRDQAILLLGQLSEVNLYHPDYIPLKELNLIAFSSLGSRLYELRERTGLFYNAQGAWARGAEREYGYDILAAILNPQNLERAETMMREVITTLATHGVAHHEVIAARQLYLKGLIDLASSTQSIAALGAWLEFMGVGFDYYDRVLAQVQALDVPDLNAIAKKYFDTAHMARVRVGRIDALTAVSEGPKA